MLFLELEEGVDHALVGGHLFAQVVETVECSSAPGQQVVELELRVDCVLGHASLQSLLALAELRLAKHGRGSRLRRQHWPEGIEAPACVSGRRSSFLVQLCDF